MHLRLRSLPFSPIHITCYTPGLHHDTSPAEPRPASTSIHKPPMMPAENLLHCHCGQSFTSTSLLLQHQESYQSHGCHHHCGKSFSSDSALRQHHEQHHKKHASEKTCRCSCGKLFKSSKGMMQHRQHSKVHRSSAPLPQQEREAGLTTPAVEVDSQVTRWNMSRDVEYCRYTEGVVGSSSSVSPPPSQPVGIGMRSSQKDDEVNPTAGHETGPSYKVPGLRQPVQSVKAGSDADDDVVPTGKEKQEGPSSVVPGMPEGDARDLTMCDEKCKYCGRCGEEYRP